MMFSRANGGAIQLSTSTVAALAAHRQVDHGAMEAGGVLLGRLILDSQDIVVDGITDPGPRDRRSRYFFYRTKDRTQLLIDQAWRDSCGTRIYLGEWHTHPEPDPTPSAHDLRNWQRIALKAVYEQDRLLFVIVGWTEVRVWEMNKEGECVFLPRVVPD